MSSYSPPAFVGPPLEESWRLRNEFLYPGTMEATSYYGPAVSAYETAVFPNPACVIYATTTSFSNLSVTMDEPSPPQPRIHESDESLREMNPITTSQDNVNPFPQTLSMLHEGAQPSPSSPDTELLTTPRRAAPQRRSRRSARSDVQNCFPPHDSRHGLLQNILINASLRNDGIVEDQDFKQFISPTDDGMHHCPAPNCMKAYPRMDRALNHFRAHLNYRPYKCNGRCSDANCKETFGTREILKAHQSKTSVQCKRCGSYLEKKNLKRHKQVTRKCIALEGRGLDFEPPTN